MMKSWLSMAAAFLVSTSLFAGQVLPDKGYITSDLEVCGEVGPSCLTGWSGVVSAEGTINVDTVDLTVTVDADVCSVVGCTSAAATYRMVQWNQVSGALQAIDSRGNYYPDLYLKFTNAGTIQFGSQSLGYMLVATQ